MGNSMNDRKETLTETQITALKSQRLADAEQADERARITTIGGALVGFGGVLGGLWVLIVQGLLANGVVLLAFGIIGFRIAKPSELAKLIGKG